MSTIEDITSRFFAQIQSSPQKRQFDVLELLVFDPVKLLRTVQRATGAENPRADLRNGRAGIIEGPDNLAGAQ